MLQVKISEEKCASLTQTIAALKFRTLAIADTNMGEHTIKTGSMTRSLEEHHISPGPTTNQHGDRVINLSHVYEKHVQIGLMFDGFLHKLLSNKNHVYAATSLVETTLRIRQNVLGNLLKTILDDPREQVAYIIQRTDARQLSHTRRLPFLGVGTI